MRYPQISMPSRPRPGAAAAALAALLAAVGPAPLAAQQQQQQQQQSPADPPREHEEIPFPGGTQGIVGGIAACPADLQRALPRCSSVSFTTTAGERALCACSNNVTVSEGQPMPFYIDRATVETVVKLKAAPGEDPCEWRMIGTRMHWLCWR